MVLAVVADDINVRVSEVILLFFFENTMDVPIPSSNFARQSKLAGR